MKRKRDILILFAAVAALFVPMLLVPSCANTTQSPTGGKKDTIPPYLVDIKPLPGTISVPIEGAKLTFTFNEYVTLKQAKNITLSPPQQKPVKAKLNGKSVIITFEEALLPETTYTLDFNDAIADNNEGNIYPGYTYVFSTGTKIDSMLITGTVVNCNDLKAVKGATVLLYRDLADSAVFLHRPYASARTDDWGFFRLPFIKDTVYRLYAIKDETSNYIYDPDTDLIAFVDSIITPGMRACDTIPEMLKYEMDDTLNIETRKSEYQLRLFREKPSKQFLKDSKRTGQRSAYISFHAPNVWIDSLWIKGFGNEKIISQFNILQDSLEIWVNDRKEMPDTFHLWVNYRKTDSLGRLKPELEHLRLAMEGGKKSIRKSRRELKHEDTICVYKLNVVPETVEQEGFELIFDQPIIYEEFNKLQFRYLNPKQKEFKGEFSVEQDSLNLRRYLIKPRLEMKTGFEYFLKVPAHSFRDISGFWCDSTEVKVTLPNDEKLSKLNLIMKGVDRKIIVDLLSDKKDEPLRQYVIDSDTTLEFPYLKEGRYRVRLTDDGNRNSIVDTGSLLEHRQPEMVCFMTFFGGSRLLNIPASAELDQTADISELFKSDSK